MRLKQTRVPGDRPVTGRRFALMMAAGVASTAGVLATAPLAHAAGGVLDPTFGAGTGIVTTALDTASAPVDAALQPDGKVLVVVGLQDFQGVANVRYGVLRYNADGTLDPTFGSGGVAAVTANGPVAEDPRAMALQSDGKIVVVGQTSSPDGTLSEFFVTRINANGTVDGSFGTGGTVNTNFVGQRTGGVSNPATAVLVQPDGKIVAGGDAKTCGHLRCPANTALARYNADGSPDTGFGTGGTVTATTVGAPSALGEDANGNIFAVANGTNTEFTSTGAQLATVTAAPITVAAHPGSAASPTAFQPNGAYLVARTSLEADDDVDAQVVRFTPTGAADPTFANAPFDFGAEGRPASDVGQSIALDANGRVVVAGVRNVNGASTIGVARLNANGALDATFGAGGTVATGVAGQGSVALVQPDGKVLVIGQGSGSGSSPVVVLRFNGQ